MDGAWLCLVSLVLPALPINPAAPMLSGSGLQSQIHPLPLGSLALPTPSHLMAATPLPQTCTNTTAIWIFRYDDPTTRRPQSQGISFGSFQGKSHQALIRFWSASLGWSRPHGSWRVLPDGRIQAFFHYKGITQFQKELVVQQISPGHFRSTNRDKLVNMQLVRVLNAVLQPIPAALQDGFPASGHMRGTATADLPGFTGLPSLAALTCGTASDGAAGPTGASDPARRNADGLSCSMHAGHLMDMAVDGGGDEENVGMPRGFAGRQGDVGCPSIIAGTLNIALCGRYPL